MHRSASRIFGVRRIGPVVEGEEDLLRPTRAPRPGSPVRARSTSGALGARARQEATKRRKIGIHQVWGVPPNRDHHGSKRSRPPHVRKCRGPRSSRAWRAGWATKLSTERREPAIPTAPDSSSRGRMGGWGGTAERSNRVGKLDLGAVDVTPACRERRARRQSGSLWDRSKTGGGRDAAPPPGTAATGKGLGTIERLGDVVVGRGGARSLVETRRGGEDDDRREVTAATQLGTESRHS